MEEVVKAMQYNLYSNLCSKKIIKLVFYTRVPIAATVYFYSSLCSFCLLGFDVHHKRGALNVLIQPQNIDGVLADVGGVVAC